MKAKCDSSFPVIKLINAWVLSKLHGLLASLKHLVIDVFHVSYPRLKMYQIHKSNENNS